QPYGEQCHRCVERRPWTRTITPGTDGDHPDHPGGERRRERHGEQLLTAEVRGDDRHHRRHRQRLDRGEEDQDDRADGDAQPLSIPDRRGSGGAHPCAALMVSCARAIRSIASVRISALVPELMRTCPAPTAPKAGPKCRATLA